MKVKSYKGRSLEKLYSMIHTELGDDAVIVHSGKTGNNLFGTSKYEVVAVSDDRTSESHILSGTAKSDEIKKLSTEQTELKSEIQKLSRTITFSNPDEKSDIPGFAKGWDFRFLAIAKKNIPGLFNKVPTDDLDKLSEILNIKHNHCPAKSSNGPLVIALVGPTGSGKTTTLAKLAAGWCMHEKLNVGLITADTYRVAAVDQAKEYATLLGLDLSVVFSAKEAARAVRSFGKKDVILVDTPGRSHHDKSGMTALKGTIDAMGDVSVFLTVPATLDRCHVPEIIRSFKHLSPEHIILTKTDEARAVPMLSTLSCETTASIAYITDGQRVPQDIHNANTHELVKMLTGFENKECTVDFVDNGGKLQKYMNTLEENADMSERLAKKTNSQIREKESIIKKLKLDNIARQAELTKQIHELESESRKSTSELSNTRVALEKEKSLRSTAESYETYAKRMLIDSINCKDMKNSEKAWFLRDAEGSIFGPTHLNKLYDWASHCRIKPDDSLSNDQVKWIPAKHLPELEMNWIVFLRDGTHYGPINIPAVFNLLEDDLDSPVIRIINKVTRTRYKRDEFLLLHRAASGNTTPGGNNHLNTEPIYELAS